MDHPEFCMTLESFFFFKKTLAFGALFGAPLHHFGTAQITLGGQELARDSTGKARSGAGMDSSAARYRGFRRVNPFGSWMNSPVSEIFLSISAYPLVI